MLRMMIAVLTIVAGLNVPVANAQDVEPMRMDVCPNDYNNFPMDGPPLICTCSGEQTKSEDTVWGANPYTAISSICRAAVQAGAISMSGGEVTVLPAAGVKVFPSVTKNGVKSASDGARDGFKIQMGASASVKTTDDAATAPAAPAADAPATTAADAAIMTMDVCPNDYSSFPTDSPALACNCPAELAKSDDTIWGANPYSGISSICRGAVQAGAITTSGGDVIVTSVPDFPVYPSTARNGVKSAGHEGGKGFLVKAGAGIGLTVAADKLTMDVCPLDFGSFPADGLPLDCRCPADLAKSDDTIWGANPYSSISSVCRAAVQSGAITTAGGDVTVTPVADFLVFPTALRNGVKSAGHEGGTGFMVKAAAGIGLTVASDKLTMDVCPLDYTNFSMESPPLSCHCPAEIAKSDDTIWGGNPYSAISSICRGAVQAGAIDAKGGDVVAVAAAKVAVFPSVTKNGVKSASHEGGDGFRIEGGKKAAVAAPAAPVEEASAPAVDAAGKPVQAPIAETLKRTGRVQLYVNFATDKAEPLASSAPVLAELLTTMRDEPDLKLALIGHTDSQGGAEYNLDLSQRRAASIYLFLVQSGIKPDRLSATGHGLVEPIADNATVEGRALNRRVEAKQMQ